MENETPFEWYQYSEKSFVVFSQGEETKEFKEELKHFGGRYNPYLKGEGGTFKGWIFAMNRWTDEFEKWLKNPTHLK